MDAKDLEKIIWPTSVDMMGQVVVAMTFFFLLMFIVLAYFLKQIELKQRVTTDTQHYQYIYEPFRKYLGQTETKKKEKQLPNIDEIILQIQDYVLSAQPSRVKDIQSLISKRNDLVDELHQLGYTGYSKTNPFEGDYGVMPIVTLELLEKQGVWKVVPKAQSVIIRFDDNSVSPDRNSQESLRRELALFVNNSPNKKLVLKSYLSERVATNNLTSWLALRRTITIRNQLRTNGAKRSEIRMISNIVDDNRYPFGAIELSYE